MKRNIFYFITAFLVSGLIVGGVIWGLKKTGKIQVNTESASEVKTIDIDELVRLLIPDRGKTVERQDIFAKLEKWVEWDSLSLHTNVGHGKCIISSNGKVPLTLKKKLEPWKWDVYIIGDGPEYHGFCLSNYDYERWLVTDPDFHFDLFKLKKGDYVDEDGHKYQFNGKIPIWVNHATGHEISNKREKLSASSYNICYFSDLNSKKSYFVKERLKGALNLNLKVGW